MVACYITCVICEFLCGDHESHEDMEKELKVFAEALDEMLNYQEKLYDEYKLIYKHIRGE